MGSGVIYVATNMTDGKQYVGLTRMGVSTRWAQHVTKSRSPKTYFHRAIAKHGPSAFAIVEFASALHEEHLSALERDVITQLSPAYNQTNGGEVTLGRKYDAVALEKIRCANTGKTRTTAQRQRISEIKKLQYAENPEMRRAATARLLAHRGTNEALRIEKVSASARGRIWSDASRAKLSAACMGRRYSDEVISRAAAKHRRAIKCDTTGVVYKCRTEAAAACGVSERSILRVCAGEYPSVKGLQFSYVR